MASLPLPGQQLPKGQGAAVVPGGGLLLWSFGEERRQRGSQAGPGGTSWARGKGGRDGPGRETTAQFSHSMELTGSLGTWGELLFMWLLETRSGSPHCPDTWVRTSDP